MPDLPPIFLNYRQEDSKDTTGRLHDDLEFVFGKQSVFMDLNSLKPGNPWPKLLRDRLNEAQVVVVVIGRDWLKVQNQNTYQRRLDEPDDWVRIEIENALRTEKTVIPVLVRDAKQPKANQLPESIRELADIQAIKLPTEYWRQKVESLVEAIVDAGVPQQKKLEDRVLRLEPSMLGVIEYFYRRIGIASEVAPEREAGDITIVPCAGMRDLWHFIDDQMIQKTPFSDTPFVSVRGQISPYAPLLFGNPMHKRQLHLELRKGAVQLIEELGYEFGELLNGLLSYSAGQMVIRPHFKGQYVYLGLYESIVRNSIPVMIDRKYFDSTLGSLFRQFNSVDVAIQGFLGEIPNYARDALDDFGISDRLKSVLSNETLDVLGSPSVAIFVKGDEKSFVTLPDTTASPLMPNRYLDGDIWVANSSNSLVTRFIDVAWREDMLNAHSSIEREVHQSRHGRGVISSFDSRLALIDETLPDRILDVEQMS